MGFWSFLSGGSTDKALGIVEKAGAGIGKFFFTDQEKSEANAKLVELWVEVTKVTANENTARSITRRILAIMFCGAYLLLLLAVALCIFIHPAAIPDLLSLAKMLTAIVLTIVVFYFGPYAIGNYLVKRENNK